MNYEPLKRYWSIYALFALYIFLVVGYFLSYSMWHFPDGVAHMGYIYDVIKDNYPNYISGETTLSPKLNYLNHPAMYYLITGELIRLLHGVSHAVVLAQMINFFISALTVYITWRSLKTLVASELAVFFGVAMLLLTPMFVELSVAVNNDPLNILGCTILFYGIVNITVGIPNFSKTTLLVFVGGFIAVMTKGTGGLAAVCMVGMHILANISLWLKHMKRLTAYQWGIIVSLVITALAYYAIQYIHYHSLFPAPQGNPADWFVISNPDKPREALFDYFTAFLNSNFDSFIKPYGHTLFIDSTLRVSVITITLSTIFILLLVVLIFNYNNDGAVRLFLIQMFLSLIVFLVFYFLVLYKMHMQTGYMGAMQARYFYGYLPLFALGIANLLDKLKANKIRNVMMLLMSASLILSAYPAWASSIFKTLGIQDVGQYTGNKTYAPLVDGRVFEQTFTAEGTKLQSMKLLLATYARVNTAIVKVNILSMDEKTLFQTYISSKDIRDNSWHNISTNLKGLVKGRMYIIRLTSPGASGDNAITWIASSGTTEDPHFVNTKFGPPVIDDGYRGGEAIVDNIPHPKENFAFQLYF
ncbi:MULTISPECIES: ArnT family glycosyltransferase [unclassified Enterobacter]|uniref:ArnT family glycosyltransferase n=1 Tax=unclassified Enterobacter TaxID=2608935 RepID=UPI003862AF31